MSEVSDLYDAWVDFANKHGLTASNDTKWSKTGEAFMAGYLTGLGSLNANEHEEKVIDKEKEV